MIDAPDNVPAGAKDLAANSLAASSRPLFFGAAALMLGIGMGKAFALPAGAASGILLGLMLLSGVLLYARLMPSGARAWVFLLLCAAFGAFRWAAHESPLPPGHIAHCVPETGDLFRMRAVVEDAPLRHPWDLERRPQRSTCVLRVSALLPAAAERPVIGRVWFAIEGRPGDLRPGDRVELVGWLAPVLRSNEPDTFDHAELLRARGIHVAGSGPAAEIRRIEGDGVSLRDWPARLQAAGVRAFQRILPPDKAGLMSALLLGHRGNLSTLDRESFSTSGVGHLLAVSGLHVQMLMLMFWWLLSACGIERPRAALATAALALAYCAVVGAQVPVVRATLMILAYLGAMVFRRRPDVLNSLGFSALAVLAFDPNDMFTASFQMSFAAVLAIVALTPVFAAAWWPQAKGPADLLLPRSKAWLRAKRCAAGAVAVSLAGWIGTAPAVAWHLGMFTPYSILTNLVAVPLSGVVLAAGTVALPLSLLPGPLPEWAGGILGATLDSLSAVTRLVAALPASGIAMPPPPALLLAAYAACWILVAAFPSKWADRPKAPAVAAILSLALLPASLLVRSAPDSLTVTFLDLGRSGATLVETPGGGAMLIDAGDESDGRRLRELLRRRGCLELSALILTRDRPDRVGGAATVLAAAPASRVFLPYSPAPSRELSAAMRSVPAGNLSIGYAGERWAGPGGTTIAWFHPPRPAPGAIGSRSDAVLRIDAGAHSVVVASLESAEAASALGVAVGAPAGDLSIAPAPGPQPPRAGRSLIIFSPTAGPLKSPVTDAIRAAGPAAWAFGGYEGDEEARGLAIPDACVRARAEPLALVEIGSVEAKASGAGWSMRAYRRGRWEPFELGAARGTPFR